MTNTPCEPRNFPNGDTECRKCGAFAAAGTALICRSTGHEAVLQPPERQEKAA